ncbi:transposase [Salinisphaera sp.]|uniref:transposase n=1 Tax=Salinisphaera sp. TaxID=1914330 RepID=UPI0039C9F758
MRYSDERREAVLKKLLPPTNQTVAELAQAEGISAATLYQWRKQARGWPFVAGSSPLTRKAGIRPTNSMP